MTDNTYIFDVAPRPDGGSITTITEDGSGVDTIVVTGTHPEGGVVGVVLARGGDETQAVASYGFERLVNGLEIQDFHEHRYVGGRIENATGGVGRERLEGNSASNILIGDPTRSGPGGADQIIGGGGDDFLYGGAGDDNMSGGTGDDQMFGDGDNDSMGGGDGNDYMEGGTGDDRLTGGTGDDLLLGGAGVDTLIGDAGSDILIGGAGDDSLQGGAGYDIAVYSGGRRGYETVTATRVGGGIEGGTDTLSGVESHAFVDGQLSFHRDGVPAQVMRLYDAAFNRIPDGSGFEVNLDAMEEGLSLAQLAQRFVDSAEFQNTYGGLTDRQFVERLYLNCLDRPGDNPGIHNALIELQSGTTRAQLLVAFSESTEHKNLTTSTLVQGMWVADDLTLQIARLYDAAWNRLPDEGGLINWRNALGAGATLDSIADAFAASREFQATYGDLSDRQFAERLYRNVLDREPDAGGLQNALASLASGMSRGQLMLAFSESPEHIALTRDLWIGGVPLLGGAASAKPEAADTPLVLPLEPDADHFLPWGDGQFDEALVLQGVGDDVFLSWDADAGPAPVALPDAIFPGGPAWGPQPQQHFDDLSLLRHDAWAI